MNERIRELAEQGGFFPELNYDHTGWHAAGHNELFEKFAELVVRECMSTLYLNGYDDAMMQLKEHFGIEE